MVKELFPEDQIMKRLVFRKLFTLIALIATVLSLSGCGGGGSSGSGTTGSLTLGITDAPVDDADKIVIEFTGIALEKSSGEVLHFDFASHHNIDVLALQDGRRQHMLDSEALGTGCYEEVHLKINADPAVTHNSHYIHKLGGQFPLHLEKVDEDKLKVQHHFCVNNGESKDLTVHFDLRKSVHCDQAQQVCTMRPTLEVVDTSSSGSISGEVDPGLIHDPSCSGGNVVYVYRGHNVVPDDVHDDTHNHSHTSHTDPAMSAHVKLDPVSGKYVYKAAFLHEGDYTVAFTCHATDDHPETHETISFTGSANVALTAAGHDITHDFR